MDTVICKLMYTVKENCLTAFPLEISIKNIKTKYIKERIIGELEW